jgi:predicted DNA-binding transcriptional regulator YafY
MIVWVWAVARALLAGYRTDMTGLTRDEARALFVLSPASAHADLGLLSQHRTAMEKVMTALPEPFRAAALQTSQRILVDPAGWMRPAEEPGFLGVLQAAVFADRRLRLRYRHSERPARGYTVDPYGLVCKGGIWYLVADHRGKAMLLRVSRVQEAALASGAVRRREGADLGSEWERLRAEVEDRPAPLRVRVAVRAAVADMFCRVHATRLAGPVTAGAQEGWREVELAFRGTAATRLLLAFGADVRG